MHFPTFCISIWPTSAAPEGVTKKNLQSFPPTYGKSQRKPTWVHEHEHTWASCTYTCTHTTGKKRTPQKKKRKHCCSSFPKFDAICLFDTNQKVKIYIMDDTDAVNLLVCVFLVHTENINILWPLCGGAQISLPPCHISPEEAVNNEATVLNFLFHIYLCSYKKCSWTTVSTRVCLCRSKLRVHNNKYRNMQWLCEFGDTTVGKWGDRRGHLTPPVWEGFGFSGGGGAEGETSWTWKTGDFLQEQNLISHNYLCKCDKHHGRPGCTGALDTDWVICPDTLWAERSFSAGVNQGEKKQKLCYLNTRTQVHWWFEGGDWWRVWTCERWRVKGLRWF